MSGYDGEKRTAWRDVLESMPAIDEPVYFHYGRTEQGRFGGESWITLDGAVFRSDAVTHWHPRIAWPDPPPDRLAVRQ